MRQRGFTILEISIVMVVLSVMSIAAYPYILQSVKISTAEKIRDDAREILNAADVFYSMNCQNAVVTTPTVANLQALNLLKSTRTIINPWGTNYTITFNNVKSLRTQIMVSATFNDAGLAGFVYARSRESRLVGTTVQWLKTPMIIEDYVLIQSLEDQGLFGAKPCVNI